ncbi:glycoside hydrolase/phage tail family protein [Rhizobium sp. CSW-27]|uniref:baseplate multidomain protein megatron n=1 Tax=Rhizobium sp. CSW-27 TaxID=2839985 RepID=UPI001C033542|nr:glycoside hydrolase/phage tail family protein [Rhizobium sp. CSW-27]MBT9368587.1 glycoside hydrolase/phage tail family protein [Rhizobium sp. CSW-27]
MATLLFQAAGAALGSVLGPVGAMLGRAAGGLAGAALDKALIAGTSTVTGTRLSTARVPGADEGAPIARVYGTARIAGTLIWATRFEEEVTVERQGGKASGGSTRVENFSYYANLAVGLCEGEIAHVRRVWADGRELDLTTLEMRLYRGSEDQLPDPLIEAKQGAGNAPAYRGLAYVVFERLPIDSFGNRIPLLQFEVLRPVGQLESQVRAVTIIPGATEFGYATVPVSEQDGTGTARLLNRHTLQAATDWQASLDELQAVCPNLQSVALVVSWFGTDLRAGDCRILPGVEVAARSGLSMDWQVAGLGRDAAHLVSQSDGAPAYGGTPADLSVLQAIADLKARGLKVYLYPFVMMDIAAGNGLPDPYGGAEQAAHPWRGRITCHPAPERAGSPDGTVTARTQVEAFFNRTDGLRRMVLHYADLALQAGGVDGMILASELVGLTRVRGEAGRFPGVEQLVQLAGDVRTRLGAATKLTYAADWSEYFGYQPQDGSGDVYFPLDALWASAGIDAVGIDNYMPLSDWRDDDLGAANPDGARLCDDPAALVAGIAGGEGFDWFYADDAARKARRRTPITDGLAGKPWIFRFKDLAGWWSNRHYERVGGAERTVPTAWLPGSKPIWFTELGCSAIDKAANQPNLFLDAKSTESGRPHFSSGARSDSMQRRALEAHHGWWQGHGAPAGMVDPDHIFLWCWDARPYPAFPNDTDAWSDGANWTTGHWLNGRLGATTLADAIAAILRDHGFSGFDVSQVSGDLTGYVQGETSSARALIEPLAETFLLDVLEEPSGLRLRSRSRVSLPPQVIAVLAERDEEAAWSETRGHDSDFAAEVVLGFVNPALDYEQASVRSRRIPGAGSRILSADLVAALAEETAQAAAEHLLRDNHLSRRMLSLPLSPAEIAPVPGDAIRIADGPDGIYLVTRIEEGTVRRIEARRHEPAALLTTAATTAARANGNAASAAFAPVLHFLDLPRFEAGEAESFARIALYAKPWRRVLISSSATTEGYRSRVTLDRPAQTGVLTAALSPGFSGRFDRHGVLELDLAFDGLASAGETAVLNGENRLAVLCASGAWEVLGFAQAEETAPGHWRLGRLLRGLAGTEDAMAAGAAAGAPAVVLNGAVPPLGLAASERGMVLNWLAEALGSGGGQAGPFAFAGGTRAETPLSPGHLRAVRGGDGVTFRWVRRGRIDADDWEASDIALDEPEERYRLEILAGETVRRLIEVSAPLALYPLASELDDFGAEQAGFRLRLRQLGRAVPLGIPLITDIVLNRQGDA